MIDSSFCTRARGLLESLAGLSQDWQNVACAPVVSSGSTRWLCAPWTTSLVPGPHLGLMTWCYSVCVTLQQGWLSPALTGKQGSEAEKEGRAPAPGTPAEDQSTLTSAELYCSKQVSLKVSPGSRAGETSPVWGCRATLQGNWLPGA